MRAGRRTQVVKGAVCKTAMQRFDPARRLHTEKKTLSGTVCWRGGFKNSRLSNDEAGIVLKGPGTGHQEACSRLPEDNYLPPAGPLPTRVPFTLMLSSTAIPN